MNKFTQPKKYSGKQLIKELKAGGVSIADDEYPLIDGNGDFWLPIEDKDLTKAQAIVSAHVGINPEITLNDNRQAILDKLNITADEAKLLLS